MRSQAAPSDKSAREVFADAADPGAIQRALDELRGGGRLRLGSGDHVVTSTIALPSGTSMIGAGAERTRIVLAPGSNCHIISNLDHRRGNTDIEVRDVALVGNMSAQRRPDGHTSTTFACGAYFKNASRVSLSGVNATGVRQTAFHFSTCSVAVVEDCHVEEVGWSGISTSGTNDLKVRTMRIRSSGLDGRHSGVHLDGGLGAHLEDVIVDGSTGNGFMLGSKFAPLRNVVVRGEAVRCLRGVAVFGQRDHSVENVMVTGRLAENRTCGVLVFNASHVFLFDVEIDGNGKPAVVLEGAAGVHDLVLAGCHITGSPEPIVSRNDSQPAYVAATTAGGHDLSSVPQEARRPAAVRPKHPRLRLRSPAQIARAFRRRWPTGRPATPDDDSFAGVCAVCGEAQTFTRRHRTLREGYRCRSCGASLRYQGQARAIVAAYAEEGASCLRELVSEAAFAQLDIWEPGVLGPFRAHLATLPGYVTSDYRPDVPGGQVVDGVRCEDMTALSFPDRSFDLVITSDIFEHVRVPADGFREVHRVLRRGGRHVFSIPIRQPWPSRTRVLVDTSGPDDVHLHPPQYHPGPNQSLHLVYNEFGRDLLDVLDEIGFHTEVVGFDCSSPEASRLLTLVSVRP